MRATRHLWAAALAVMVAGCGGGDSPGSATTPEAAVSGLRAQAQALLALSPADAANQLMDFGEAHFPFFFPGHKPTASFPPFLYRFYPETGSYLGVVVTPNPTYLFNGVYVMGGAFGNSPLYVGQLSDIIPDPGAGTGTNRTLVVTVNTLGTITTFNVGSVPLPASQGEFCSGLATDTTFAQIGIAGGGTVTINSCSFTGNTGTIQATLFASTAYDFFTLPLTITYSFQ